MLNESPGINLSRDDMACIERMQLKLSKNQALKKAMTSTTALEKMKFNFDKAVDDLLLDFIGAKLDLYMTEPKINMIFKSKWFEVYRRQTVYS